jgi:hypothetical protein
VEKHHDAQYEQEWQAEVATQCRPGHLHCIHLRTLTPCARNPQLLGCL